MLARIARRASGSGACERVRQQVAVDALEQQLARHLAVELAVEPVDEAALLGALARWCLETAGAMRPPFSWFCSSSAKYSEMA